MAKKSNGPDETKMADEIELHAAKIARRALDLADETDKAGEEMRRDAEQMLRVVEDGMENICRVVREKMVQFAEVMEKYGELTSRKNSAFLQAGQNAIATMEAHAKHVEAALAIADQRPEQRAIPRFDAEIKKAIEAGIEAAGPVPDKVVPER